MTKLKLSAPQFVLLTKLVNPEATVEVPTKGSGWVRFTDEYRADVAGALVSRGLAERIWVYRRVHMRPTEAGTKHWNEVNAACRAK